MYKIYQSWTIWKITRSDTVYCYCVFKLEKKNYKPILTLAVTNAHIYEKKTCLFLRIFLSDGKICICEWDVYQGCIRSAYAKNWKYPKYPSKDLISVHDEVISKYQCLLTACDSLFLAPLKIRVLAYSVNRSFT